VALRLKVKRSLIRVMFCSRGWAPAKYMRIVHLIFEAVHRFPRIQTRIIVPPDYRHGTLLDINYEMRTYLLGDKLGEVDRQTPDLIRAGRAFRTSVLTFKKRFRDLARLYIYIYI